MRKQSQYNRNLNIIVLLSMVLFCLVITATLSYMLLLDVSFIDALYMTVITISTVGYKEVGAMSPQAKIFSIIFIIISFGTVAFMFSKILSFIVEGDLKEEWGRRNLEKRISMLEKHTIICGAGQTGTIIIKEFLKQDIPFVVIENNDEIIEALKAEDINFIHGDATNESNLEKAMISKAKGLIASLSKDTDNLYLVLTARKMKEDLFIISRAYDSASSEKLILGGADQTVSPNEIGRKRIANIMINPSITTFIDTIVDAGDVFLSIEEIILYEDYSVCGKPIGDITIEDKTGIMILGIRKEENGEFLFNPNEDIVLTPGDTLVVLGQKGQLDNLKKIIKE